MERLSETISRYAQGQPEGTPVLAKGLLHLGSRAAVDQALSRLVRRGVLLRVGRGVYVLPVEPVRPPRAVGREHRRGTRGRMRRTHREQRGDCRERVRPDHAGARQARLSDVGEEPDVDVRPRAGRTAPRAAVATGAGRSARRRCDPCACLARAWQGQRCDGGNSAAVERRRAPGTRQRERADAGRLAAPVSAVAHG